MKFKFVKGMEGMIAAQSSISHVDGEKGKLVYRGFSIEDLCRYSSFEEVAYILWYGDQPTKSQLLKFKRELFESMKLPSGFKRMILPNRVPVMASLRTCVSLLSGYDKTSDDVSSKVLPQKAVRILGAMPSIIAALARVREGRRILSPKKDLSFAANFLYMLTGKVPSFAEENIMDVCLILHAEHGLNASTFSSRVTVATLSDLYSGMTSALGTLKGPLHGGANVKAIDALHSLSKKFHAGNTCVGKCLVHVDEYVDDAVKKHMRIMGIGHRVYKVKDPRAKILEEYARDATGRLQGYYQIAKEIEKDMAEQKGLYPNVDFFSGIVYERLGIKTDLFVAIFALSRTAGWLAHMIEQLLDNRLIRPRQLYVGRLKRKYVQRR